MNNTRVFNNQKYIQKDVDKIERYIEEQTAKEDEVVYIPLDRIHIHRVKLNDKNLNPPSAETYETLLSQKLHLITKIDYSCNALRVDLNNKDYHKKIFKADAALFLGCGLTTFWLLFICYMGIYLNTINPYAHVFVNNAIIDPFICVGVILASAIIGGCLLFYSFDWNNFIKRCYLNRRFLNQ